MVASDENRDRYLRKTYGISLRDYARILAKQGGHCGGCKSVGVTRSLHLDHDHKTGFVRGILCASCNSALRKLKDDPVIADALAAYLRQPPARLVMGRDIKVEVKPRRRRRRKAVRQT